MTQKKVNPFTFESGIFNSDLFVGHYNFTGSNYYQHSEHSQFIIKVCERKNQTKNKPPLYIVSKSSDKEFPFLSSLYPTQLENCFIAEINRQYFKVTRNEDSLTIDKK
jgi:hypothetical protein